MSPQPNPHEAGESGEEVGGAGRGDGREEAGEAQQQQVEEDQELFHLAHRALPDLPPPTPGAGEEDGWQAINRIGALNSFLCQFPLLQECPEQHKSAWARTHGYDRFTDQPFK